MKTLKLFLLLAILFSSAAVMNLHAQNPCGVDARIGITNATTTNVYFRDSSIVQQDWAVMSWHWTFGDGTGSTQQHVQHSYAQPGTYNVCLRIEGKKLNSGGPVFCQDSVCRQVTIPQGCNTVAGDFIFTTSGFTTAFTPFFTSNYPPIRYYWNFGDGHTSYDINPVHTYTAAGVYNVCVSVKDSANCIKTVCHNDTIRSGAGNPCANVDAKFTISQSGGGTVVLQSTSTGVPQGALYKWTMDGNALGTPGPNTAYTLTNVSQGVHYFCLFVYGANSQSPCDSVCRTETIGNGGNGCNSVTASFVHTIIGNTVSMTASPNNPTGTLFQWSLNGVKTAFAPTYKQYQYANLPAGTHTICLYVKAVNSTTVCDSLCKTITITSSNPCTGFTADFSFMVQPNGNVRFAPADSTRPGVSHVWSFGDNTSSTDKAPNHIYTSPGVYRVCHYAYIPGTNCIDSVCKSVTVGNINPCAGIQAYFIATFNGQILNLSAAGTYPQGARFQWTLDGGQRSTATTANKEYKYQNVSYGSHNVCLYVYAANSTTPCDSFCKNVTAPNPCSGLTAAWTKTVLQNGAVKFTPTAINAQGVLHAWSFGDGTTSNDISPVHSYPASGLYRVCHYVYIPGTSCADSSCNSIQVNVSNSCTGFTAFIQDRRDTSLGGFRHELTARATTLDTNLVYKWSTNQTTASIIVNQPGVYCVTVTKGNCTAVACDSVGNNASICQAKYRYEPTSAVNGVKFVDLSTGSDPIIAWKWSFGDGNGSVNTNPVHVYANSGTYQVCLTITTASGCTSTKCDSVRVAKCYGLNAAWTQIYLNNGGVQFKGVMNGLNIAHRWSFGDGTTSTNADPVHHYAASGLYTVCHIVTIPGTNCADTSCRSIQAGASSPCHADFKFQAIPGGSSLKFFNTSTGTDSATNYLWTFGDGSTSTLENPTHQYNALGVKYKVCLTITTGRGCTNTYCDSVRTGANSPCKASFKWRAVNCLKAEFTSTSPAGYYFQKWYFGDGTTDTVANPTHTYTQSGTYRVVLESYYTNQCVGRDTVEVVLPNCAGNDTICGVVFGDSNNNGVMDGNETGITGVKVLVGNVTVETDSNGAYRVILPPGPHYVYIITPAGCIPTLPYSGRNGANNGYFINGRGGTYCGYNFGVNCNIVHICGVVYFDANNNGVKDSIEAGIPAVHVLLMDSSGKVRHAYTNAHGEYCITAPASLYTITIAPQQGAVVRPTSIPLNASTGGQQYGNNNFAVYRQPGQCDLKVELTPHTCVSPGFPAWYSIQVCNVGTNPGGGTVNMSYDASLDFGYARPAHSSHNASTRTITWPVNNLMPGQCAYYWVTFRAKVPLTLGDPAINIASIVTNNGCNDVRLGNNVDTLNQVIKGSWDPNNKLVDPIGQGDEGFIRGTEELTYTINFQNTGTAPAVNVIVKDALPANLDLQTFRMVSSNPAYTSMQIDGDSITWLFSNIMLPDSNTDEPGSHGYVSFAILPVPGLPQSTVIHNIGDIYFDYNEAIITERTVNTIDYALSVDDVDGPDVTITLMPNPFKDFTTIKVEGSQAPYELRVYDLLGKVVSRQIAESNIFRVERGSIAAGVYLYEVLQKDKTIGKGKMIAE